MGPLHVTTYGRAHGNMSAICAPQNFGRVMDVAAKYHKMHVLALRPSFVNTVSEVMEDEYNRPPHTTDDRCWRRIIKGDGIRVVTAERTCAIAVPHADSPIIAITERDATGHLLAWSVLLGDRENTFHRTGTANLSIVEAWLVHVQQHVPDIQERDIAVMVSGGIRDCCCEVDEPVWLHAKSHFPDMTNVPPGRPGNGPFARSTEHCALDTQGLAYQEAMRVLGSVLPQTTYDLDPTCSACATHNGRRVYWSATHDEHFEKGQPGKPRVRNLTVICPV